VTTQDPSTTTALLSVIETLRDTNGALRAEMARLVKMVEGLTQQLDILLAQQGEERRAELAELRAEARAIAEAQAVAETQAQLSGETSSPPDEGASAKAPRSRPRSKHGRGALPANLPRDVQTLRPEVCEACGCEELLVAETLVSEELDYVRAHLRVRRTERTVCRCLHCNERVTPEQPPMPFDRAACTMDMMAWLLFAKCGLFLPLDRLRRDLERQGAPVASSTLTRWWQRGADLLLPIAEVLRLSLLQGDHVHTDGTGLYVVFPRLKANPKKGESRPGLVDADGLLIHRKPECGQVLIFGDDRHAVYHFTNSKEGYHAEDFLLLGHDDSGLPIRWTGTITADAVSSQDCLFLSGERVEAGCNAHGLRKFRDDADKAPLLASRAMGFIGAIYEVEARAREDGLVGDALLARRQLARPVMADFKTWLNVHLTDLLPKNPVRKAMQYYINHWEALTRFLEDAEVRPDNNAAERDLRKVALLRNNSLYASGEEGAIRLCTLLTLINTCARIGVEPYGYLVWALTHIVPHSSNRGLRAEDLTPAAYQAEQQRDAG